MKALEKINSYPRLGLHFTNNVFNAKKHNFSGVLKAEIYTGSAYEIKGAFIPKYHDVCKNTTIVLGTGERLKSMIEILKSRVILFWASNETSKCKKFYFGVEKLKSVPLPEKFETVKLATINDYLRFLESKTSSQSWTSNCEFASMIMLFEQLSNLIVYELYFPEQIKESDAEIIKHIQDMPDLSDDDCDFKKFQKIEKTYHKLTGAKSTIAKSQFRFECIPAVRTIEGIE